LFIFKIHFLNRKNKNLINYRNREFEDLSNNLQHLKNTFNIPSENDIIRLISTKEVECPYKICGGDGNINPERTRHLK
jgi:hypothetical protein